MANTKSEKWAEVICSQCKKDFKALLSNIRRGRQKFCSRKCSSRSQAKSEPVEFQGKLYYLNSHDYYESAEGRPLSRVIWEAHYGPIPPRHKLYFRDGVRSNCAIENLYLKDMESGCRECGKKIYARGLCHKHYEQARAKGIFRAKLTISVLPLLFFLLPARGTVNISEKKCDYFVVQTVRGYSVLKAEDGEIPIEGDEVAGLFEDKKSVKLRNVTKGVELTVKVEDERMKRSEAVELYYLRCER